MTRKTKSTKVLEAFIKPMVRGRYIPPAGFQELLEEKLEAHGEKELRDAASYFTIYRTATTFPTLDEIVTAIEHVKNTPIGINRSRLKHQPIIDQFGVKRWIPPSYREKQRAEREEERKSEEQKKLARREACQRIRCTSLGPIADREGWLHGLIDFVAEHSRMPDSEEQAGLSRVAAGIQRNLDKLPLTKPQPRVKGWITLGGSGLTQALINMRKKMVDKAYREVFGEFTPPAPKDPDPGQAAYAEAMAAAPAATPAVLPKGFV